MPQTMENREHRRLSHNFTVSPWEEEESNSFQARRQSCSAGNFEKLSIDNKEEGQLDPKGAKTRTTCAFVTGEESYSSAVRQAWRAGASAHESSRARASQKF